MNYVYIHSEHSTDHDLYTVGFYDPQGKFQTDSDHSTKEAAANRVIELNGGKPAKNAPQELPSTPPVSEPARNLDSEYIMYVNDCLGRVNKIMPMDFDEWKEGQNLAWPNVDFEIVLNRYADDEQETTLSEYIKGIEEGIDPDDEQERLDYLKIFDLKPGETISVGLDDIWRPVTPVSELPEGLWEVRKQKKSGIGNKGYGFAILQPLITKEGEYKGQRGGFHVVVHQDAGLTEKDANNICNQHNSVINGK